MGFFSRDKGKSTPAKFGGGWDKDKKAAKEKVDKGAKQIEKDRGTDGRGTRRG